MIGSWVASLVGVLACAPAGPAEGADVTLAEEEDPRPEPEGIFGTVSADTGLSAVVDVVRSFGAISDGTLIVYGSSTPTATCADVVRSLTQRDEDPRRVMTGGTCNVLILVGGYTGALEVEDDLMTAVASNLSCAMGEGEWVTGEDGAAWTGTWWQGFPTGYQWVFQGSSVDELWMDVEMTTYDGSFPYEQELRVAPASGLVAGALAPEDCPELIEWWD